MRDQWSRLYMPKREKSSDKLAPRIRPETSVRSPSAGVWAGAALIAIAAFIAYLPSINGGFVWDDDLLLTNNYLIKAADGLHRFWCTTEAKDYWPATNTSFWIEWRLWGMNSTGYHVSNLILHIAESLLIWIVLRKLSIPGAFLAAMIFAVHPVNVESVAWIAQRKNTMAMLFFLLSVLWYLKAGIQTASTGMAPARSHGGPCERENTPLRVAAKQSTDHCPPSTAHRSSWYWLSLAAFSLAMLGKGSVAVMPVLLLGIVWWLRPLTRWDLVRTAPFFLVAAVLSGVNMWFQTHGSGEVIRIAGFAERLLGAGCAVWFYLYKALLPIDLAPIYRQWHIEAGNLLWWLPLAAAFAVTLVLWMYRKRWARSLLFAWGFFCVALVPVLGFTDVLFMRYSLVADRYQHIAIIGVIALVTAGYSAWAKRKRYAMRLAAMLLIIAVAGALTFLTWRQNGNYRDEIALYKATLDKNPDSWISHYTLGFALAEKGKPQESIEQFETALRLNHELPEAHNNLGAVLAKIDRIPDAIEHFRQAIQIRPGYVEARYRLASALVQIGKFQEAIEQYEQVLLLRPDDAGALNNMAYALSQANRLEEAIARYKQALQLKPDNPEAYNILGIALVKVGRLGKAMEYFQQALTLNPKNSAAHFNLGNTLFSSGRLPEAIEHYKQALKLDPEYPEALRNLGSALVQTGRPAEAIEYYRRSLKLQPDVASVYYNMAVAYAQAHQSAEAVASARKAMELAQSQGQAAEAKIIEDWLNSYRAGLSNPPNTPPSSKSDLPRP
jgi:tetratricopeptide (TPR) repeat protein